MSRAGHAHRRRHRRDPENIIAERVLGLPGDIRVDKDVPFKDMPRGR